jgi:hypothetical protein
MTGKTQDLPGTTAGSEGAEEAEEEIEEVLAVSESPHTRVGKVGPAIVLETRLLPSLRAASAGRLTCRRVSATAVHTDAAPGRVSREDQERNLIDEAASTYRRVESESARVCLIKNTRARKD